MHPDPRTLSSPRTFFAKVVLPPLWIGGFGFATFSLFFLPNFWSHEGAQPVGASWKWILLLTTVAGTLVIWWSSVRLKRVRIDDKSLYISNYLTEIAVALANVAGVDEVQWLNYRLIKIGFLSSTEFGDHVVFQPRIRWFLSPMPVQHPVVDEIRKAVHQATGRSIGGVSA